MQDLFSTTRIRWISQKRESLRRIPLDYEHGGQVPLQEQAIRRLKEQAMRLLFGYRAGWLAHRGPMDMKELPANYLLWLKQDYPNIFEYVTVEDIQQWLQEKSS